VGSPDQIELIFTALDAFRIELPSWGFANTGTRFGKFLQKTAAVTTDQKLEDAGQVHHYTGCCPTVALHVLWDLPAGLASVEEVKSAAARHGVGIGSINPNLFQDQIYKHGSFGNPDPAVREAAVRHCFECVEIQDATGSRDLSLWFADGSSYPGTQSIRRRKEWFQECLQALHARLSGRQRMLVEYKPFEPFFYHTDLGDWGMAYLASKAAGPSAKVLVDTGHHYQAQNIEQIVAWLLSERMLGGFHFNDRRYADDDLTMGSVDPYQIFRIFHEIAMYEWETGEKADIAYMVDQSHNLKNKVEEMIQTAVAAQEIYAKAALVDHEALSRYQDRCDLIAAEECLKEAFATDVRPAIREWRRARGIPENPLRAIRESGYLQRIAAERAAGAQSAGSSYA
jgi:L-rhamnose isomerase/sugar isomerase